ncbi:hypothetical protein KIPB_014058, partial [Kipferlia bialata]
LIILALVPNTAEFVNAIQFALQDNLSLATEIGRSAALQIACIQAPVLVLYSLFLGPIDDRFSMIFPMIDFWAILFSVIIIVAQSESRSLNYFKGFALIAIYSGLVAAFYYKPDELIPDPGAELLSFVKLGSDSIVQL